MKIQDLIEFTKFTHSFQQIKRVIYANGEDRNENDAEHSYQLAMACWLVVETKKLKLDLNKIVKYALVHDLVEIYAGDTYFYSTDKNMQEKKLPILNIYLDKGRAGKEIRSHTKWQEPKMIKLHYHLLFSKNRKN